MSKQHFDVVIIGAGLSGIGTAYYLQRNSPQKSYVILEGRENLGGTWDLFRYPGIRSDTSMLTMAYGFKPWKGTQVTAAGSTILEYVRETAVENNIDQHIRYGQLVEQASWSTADAMWTIKTKSGDIFSCNMLLVCAGYYSYESGYTPEFEGLDQFEGTIIHPQKWPEDLDYADKKVVIIGSGATAVTLAPELAKQAAQVTMLQRSPTYMRPMPNQDPLATKLRRFMSPALVNRIMRWRGIVQGLQFYTRARNNPAEIKQFMINNVRAELPPDYDVDTHFTPSYNPWDQRICLVPDSDLFQAISNESASVVTDHIDSFVPHGIQLRSGDRLEADIVITATGLKLEVMGGINFEVDGQPISFADTFVYKGMMVSGVPNMVFLFGYINAAWTLRVDLTAEYICRLLNYMDQNKVKSCTPIPSKTAITETQPWVNTFTSGYFQRDLHRFPKQGASAPWVNTQNYWRDKKIIEHAPIEDIELRFE